jgi:hypothetical protein
MGNDMTRNRTTANRNPLLLALMLLTFAGNGFAGGYHGGGQQSYRVDVNLYGNGELNIKRWLEKYAGIDTDHYYLTGIVVHASPNHHGHGGHALLRVGSNYAPRIDLRPGHNYIRAPAYDDGKWRLYVREGAQVDAVTLHVQPRERYAYGAAYDYRRGLRHEYRYDDDHRWRDHDDRRHDPWPPRHGRPLDRHHRHDRHCRH